MINAGDMERRVNTSFMGVGMLLEYALDGRQDIFYSLLIYIGNLCKGGVL